MSQTAQMSRDSKSGDAEKGSAETMSSSNNEAPVAEYLSMKAVLLIMISLYFSIFLVALVSHPTAFQNIVFDFS